MDENENRVRTVTRGEADPATFDLLVVGGGIIGAGVARDAAGRGLRVMLCDRDDLGGATSSASSKLVHGGLRYLEHLQIWLVREALAEREVLLDIAPHVVRQLNFVLPHDPSVRAAWRPRLGLFLYDHLARRRRMPRSRSVRFEASAMGAPLKATFPSGFLYADCWVDDSRLVLLNALDASEHGAVICPRTEILSARRTEEAWLATARDTATGRLQTIRARILINATGPWVGETLHRMLDLPAGRPVRLLKGSHIVTRRLYDGPFAYFVQNTDGRLVYVLPFEDDFTLIGTTDVALDERPGPQTITGAEIDYLCAAVNRSFNRQTVPADVVWSFAGVRPLYDDAALESPFVARDYVVKIRDRSGALPVLSIFGGKITTYRRIAERVVDRLQRYLPGLPRAWTATAPLPGGDFADLTQLEHSMQARFPHLPATLLGRLARCYGTRADRILGGATRLADLGAHFGAGLTEAEVMYLRDVEWARTSEDVLWRRTKLGLRLSPADVARVAACLAPAVVEAAG